MNEANIKSVDLSVGYEEIEPVGNYILVEVKTKELLKTSGGIFAVQEGQDQKEPACFIVLKVSKDIMAPRIKSGDSIEVDSMRLVTFWTPDGKYCALIKLENISAVYSKKE